MSIVLYVVKEVNDVEEYSKCSDMVGIGTIDSIIPVIKRWENKCANVGVLAIEAIQEEDPMYHQYFCCLSEECLDKYDVNRVNYYKHLPRLSDDEKEEVKLMKKRMEKYLKR